MDPAIHDFDAEAMLARLRRWVECESPTFEHAAVNRMMDVAAADLAGLGAAVERISLGNAADAVRARLPHARRGEPGILVVGHLDTVHPLGTLAAMPFRVERSRCYGPGILDMKGGCRAAMEAIEALQAAGIETPLPVTVLFTPDEEIGSPASRALIEQEARRQKVVLVPEPAHADGVITGRYAIARFRLATFGRPSHAGATLGEGRSAIREMARRILAVEAMTGDDCTFSVGVVEGGRWVNCVSTLCRAEALSMAKRQADLDAGVARMMALAGEHDGTRFEVELGVVRPVWEPTPATLALFDTTQALAAGQGLVLGHGSAGGGSDGNFTGAMGIATLDGLGLRGAGYHTLDEHVEVASLVERTRLIAGLLRQLN